MADWEKANQRLTTITSWLIGMSAIFIVLVLTALPDTRNTVHEELRETFYGVVIISLIGALTLFSLAASYLAAPYYDVKTNEGPTEKKGSRRARSLTIAGAVVIFWAIGFLVAIRLDFTYNAWIYFIVALLAPFVWLGSRAAAKMEWKHND